MHIDNTALADMPSRQRAALVNSLSGFKSANLIGTAADTSSCNLAIMSSVVHLGSHPPLLALVVRPGGDERHTLANILDTQQYSINHVSHGIVEAAHQTAARYPQSTSEFEATGLTPEWWPNFSAPLVAEASVKMAMQLREHQELKINGTHLVIGEVIRLDVPDDSVNEDFSLNLVATGTTALTGLDSYHSATLDKKMAYAKPDSPPRAIR